MITESSLAGDMPRNPDKEIYVGQVPKDEDKLVSEELGKMGRSKAWLVAKLIRYWLGEIGKMPRVDLPKNNTGS